jgi:DNA-binding GntR family transcriptional regulator
MIGDARAKIPDMPISSPGQTHRRVAASIRSRILAGQVRPGQPIRLNALADELKVSVTPVREALLMLAQDGWLVHEPNRGFQVRSIRRQDIEDVYRVWAFTEGELAASAAAKASLDDVVKLRRVDDEINSLSDAADHRALELNDLFHDLLHEIGDAPKLTWFVEASRRVVPFRVADSFEQVPGWAEINRTQHAPIVDAIERRDSAAARDASQLHLETAGRLLISWLDQLDFWGENREPTASVSDRGAARQLVRRGR